MKRNNIFMWAYISIILICVVIRFWVNYPIWNAVVLSITISSAFFAAEDLSHATQKHISKYSDLIEMFISETEKDLDMYAFVSTEMHEIISHYQKHTDIPLHLLADHHVNAQYTEDRISKLMENLRQMKDSVQKQRKEELKYNKVSELYTFIGFLSIFLVLFFYQYIHISAFTQEMVTVLSFGMILITQQINISVDDRLQKELHDIQCQLAQGYEQNKYLLQLERELQMLVSINEQMEVPSNAH